MENLSEHVEETMISQEIHEEIAKKIAAIKTAKPNVKRIFPIYVEGDEFDEKPYYIAYFTQPGFAQFSKFLTLSQKDALVASRALAKECFLDGDKELVDDDSLYQFGLAGQFSRIISTRKGTLVNLSKAGK